MAEKSCVRPTLPLNGATAAVLELPPLLPLAQRAPPVVPDWAAPRAPVDFDLDSLPVLYWLATLTRATYSPTATVFTQVARCVVPNDYPITYVPNAGLTPGFAMIVCPQIAIICVSGTTNLGQWLTQIFNTALASFSYAGTENIPALKNAHVQSLYDAAAVTLDAATATARGTRRLLLVGHSMGGAIAEVLAARELTRARPPQVLTFAAPKPGDQFFATALTSLAAELKRLWISNDFIPALPPDLGALRLVAPAVFRETAQTWAEYRQPGRLGSLAERGGIELAGEPQPVLQIAGAMIAAAAGRPLQPATAHTMAEYCRRLGADGATSAAAARLHWRNPRGIDAANEVLSGSNL